MSKIKLILSDIDGTLVPLLGSNPSKKVIDITKQVQKLGVEIAPVTGRPYDMNILVFMTLVFLMQAHLYVELIQER